MKLQIYFVAVCLFMLGALPHALVAQCPSAFYDGFESGNWTPTWSPAGGTYTRSVITTSPAVGTYCYTQTGSSGHYQGTMATYPSSTPPTISFWVKTSTTTAANGYVIVGDANTSSNQGILFSYFTSSGTYRIYSGSYGDYSVPATPNTWIFVELRNINFTTKTYDIWINGALGQANFGFRSQTTTSVDRVFLYNYTSATAYYDDINIGGVSLNVSASPTDVLCFGDSTGTATASVSGGTPSYTYAWSNGGNGATISALSAGTYGVTVTDGLGCQGSASTTVGSPTAITSAVSPMDALCHGDSTGSAGVNASGGTPGYTYLWSNGDTSQNAGGLPAGSYMVTVTDGNACTHVDSGTVNEPPLLVLAPQVTEPSCNGLSDGSITMVPSGGTPGYFYTWNTGATSAGISGLSAGTYTVFVSDSLGCSDGSIIQLGEPSPIVSSSTSTPVSCNGDDDGAIDLTVTGGSPSYTYLWSNGSTSEDPSGLAGGTYTVVVTDSNGCSIMDTVVVSEPAAINHSATILDDTGLGNGAIDLAVSGGVSPYTFQWSNGATTEDLSNLSAGTYTVTITDNVGCTTTITFTVSLVIGIADHATGPHVEVAPNPIHASGLVNVTISHFGDGDLHVSIVDLQGRTLHQVHVQAAAAQQVQQLDLHHLSAGTYLLQVASEQHTAWTRVVKQ